ncbi:MAG: hypothetical protein QM535_20125 [Limnohabitans sp.]|nr:hypothetical protein [Limnohabitans sp.]
MSEFEKYYIAQAGNGIAGFNGVRYQKGKGFFGKVLSGAVFPLLKFLGKNFLQTGVNFANDLLESDDFSIQNVKSKAKKNINASASKYLGDDFKLLKGEGRKRKRRKKYIRKRKIKNLSTLGLKVKRRKVRKYKKRKRRIKKSENLFI